MWIFTESISNDEEIDCKTIGVFSRKELAIGFKDQYINNTTYKHLIKNFIEKYPHESVIDGECWRLEHNEWEEEDYVQLTLTERNCDNICDNICDNNVWVFDDTLTTDDFSWINKLCLFSTEKLAKEFKDDYVNKEKLTIERFTQHSDTVNIWDIKNDDTYRSITIAEMEIDNPKVDWWITPNIKKARRY